MMGLRTGANLDPTGEDMAKRLKAGALPPIEVDTREAFEKAVATMLRTGQPISAPSRKALEEWVGPLDELGEGDAYDG